MSTTNFLVWSALYYDILCSLFSYIRCFQLSIDLKFDVSPTSSYNHHYTIQRNQSISFTKVKSFFLYITTPPPSNWFQYFYESTLWHHMKIQVSQYNSFLPNYHNCSLTMCKISFFNQHEIYRCLEMVMYIQHRIA